MITSPEAYFAQFNGDEGPVGFHEFIQRVLDAELHGSGIGVWFGPNRLWASQIQYRPDLAQDCVVYIRGRGNIGPTLTVVNGDYTQAAEALSQLLSL